jgi:hypothetical protein
MIMGAEIGMLIVETIAKIRRLFFVFDSSTACGASMARWSTQCRLVSGKTQEAPIHGSVLHSRRDFNPRNVAAECTITFEGMVSR